MNIVTANVDFSVLSSSSHLQLGRSFTHRRKNYLMGPCLRVSKINFVGITALQRSHAKNPAVA